jgi:hypothetical protein
MKADIWANNKLLRSIKGERLALNALTVLRRPNHELPFAILAHLPRVRSMTIWFE